MSLIKCPECGKVFSDRSHHCPQCGIDTASAIQAITGANRTAPSPFAAEAHQDTPAPQPQPVNSQPQPVNTQPLRQAPMAETPNENIQNFNAIPPSQQSEYHYYTPQPKNKPSVGRILLYILLIVLICGGIFGITVMLDKSGLLNTKGTDDSIEVAKPLPQDPSFDEFDGFESDQPAVDDQEAPKQVEKKAAPKPADSAPVASATETAPAHAEAPAPAAPAPVEAPAPAPVQAPVQQPAE